MARCVVGRGWCAYVTIIESREGKGESPNVNLEGSGYFCALVVLSSHAPSCKAIWLCRWTDEGLGVVQKGSEVHGKTRFTIIVRVSDEQAANERSKLRAAIS